MRKDTRPVPGRRTGRSRSARGISRPSAGCSSPTGVRSPSGSSGPAANWASRRSPSTAMPMPTHCTCVPRTWRAASVPHRPPRAICVADAVIEAAVETAAEAIHPGYGFLSEQAAFAEAVEARGIVFVGPTPATLAGLGDKIAARQSARANDVPIVPGTFEPIAVGGPDDAARIASVAAAIGYPVLVKAAAGGGGRGMRRVDDPAGLADGRDRGGRGGAPGLRVGQRVPGALRRGRPSHRGPVAGRCARQHRGSGRAGLFGPAPTPEAGGGGACTRSHARCPTTCPRARGSGRPVGGPAQRGDRGVPVRAIGRLLLPGGQCPPSGRTWCDGAGERHRPGP